MKRYYYITWRYKSEDIQGLHFDCANIDPIEWQRAKNEEICLINAEAIERAECTTVVGDYPSVEVVSFREVSVSEYNIGLKLKEKA